MHLILGRLLLVFFLVNSSHLQAEELKLEPEEEKYRFNFMRSSMFEGVELELPLEMKLKLNQLAEKLRKAREQRLGIEKVNEHVLDCSGNLRRALAMYSGKRHVSHIRKIEVWYEDDEDYYYFFANKEKLFSRGVVAVHKKTGYPYFLIGREVDALAKLHKK